MTDIGSGKRSYDGPFECSRSIVTKAGFLFLTKIINLRLRVDDLYYVCQSLYHNLAIVCPAVVYYVFFPYALSRRQLQRGAALRQIFVDVDLFGAAVCIA